MFPVSPLSTPGQAELIHLDRLAANPSVTLLVERSGLPNLRATRQNARSVTEICVRLDGMPLAIKLAAVRLKVFSPGELVTRLEGRMRLLTDGDEPDLACNSGRPHCRVQDAGKHPGVRRRAAGPIRRNLGPHQGSVRTSRPVGSHSQINSQSLAWRAGYCPTGEGAGSSAPMRRNALESLRKFCYAGDVASHISR